MKFQVSKCRAVSRHLLLMALLLSISATAVQAEPVMLFSRVIAEAAAPAIPASRSRQRSPRVKLDEKGDLLVQFAGARFTVAYNSPVDPLKPSEPPRTPQREENVPINGISLVASLPF
ncbi:MAG TPA: hypothetical protein HPP94_11135 [Desulfuromonadales bacterium]|nr:hypothetical protein [Desulfuromonadales bacterium]